MTSATLPSDVPIPSTETRHWDAAVHLFWERGYEATSIGELTEAMGIRPASTQPSATRRPSSKRQREAYGRAPEGSFIARAIAGERKARKAFTRILHEAAAIYTDPSHPPGCLAITAATNVTPQDAEVATFLRDVRNVNLKRFESRLQTAQGDGEFPASADPKTLTHIADQALRTWPH